MGISIEHSYMVYTGGIDVEISEKIKSELTKNQIARLFTLRVSKHFTKYAEMDREDFFKYLQEANDEMKGYLKEGKDEAKRK